MQGRQVRPANEGAPEILLPSSSCPYPALPQGNPAGRKGFLALAPLPLAPIILKSAIQRKRYFNIFSIFFKKRRNCPGFTGICPPLPPSLCKFSFSPAHVREPSPHFAGYLSAPVPPLRSGPLSSGRNFFQFYFKKTLTNHRRRVKIKAPQERVSPMYRKEAYW